MGFGGFCFWHPTVQRAIARQRERIFIFSERSRSRAGIQRLSHVDELQRESVTSGVFLGLRLGANLGGRPCGVGNSRIFVEVNDQVARGIPHEEVPKLAPFFLGNAVFDPLRCLPCWHNAGLAPHQVANFFFRRSGANLSHHGEQAITAGSADIRLSGHQRDHRGGKDSYANEHGFDGDGPHRGSLIRSRCRRAGGVEIRQMPSELLPASVWLGMGWVGSSGFINRSNGALGTPCPSATAIGLAV